MGHLLRLAKKQPVLRAREVARQGIHTSALTRMTKSGVLERLALDDIGYPRERALPSTTTWRLPLQPFRGR